jgi:hypothetical protein
MAFWIWLCMVSSFFHFFLFNIFYFWAEERTVESTYLELSIII